MKRTEWLRAGIWKRELVGTLKFIVIVFVVVLAIALTVAWVCQM